MLKTEGTRNYRNSYPRPRYKNFVHIKNYTIFSNLGTVKKKKKKSCGTFGIVSINLSWQFLNN